MIIIKPRHPRYYCWYCWDVSLCERNFV